ncbi:V-type H+-transporting ATPase subunit D [Nematocida displodere]|uniref:V-type H+-transporting ATPase subunit D n=1 Tax=Nematocida displodere TaxID=1805483 RepID=A0A177EDM9_9MICR|nr:V-type H+-transporting ATPase subunit D [Nematocida displodere]
MSGTDQKLPVFPTRMTLGILQARTKSAEKGKCLIKRKSDAIQIRHKELAQELWNKKKELGKKMESAFFLLTRAEFYGGDLRLAMHQAKNVPLSVQATAQTIAGMAIPAYTIPEEVQNMFFVGQSGQIISECRMQFISSLALMVEIASTQLSFRMLDEMLLLTNRRVNALEHILIPKLENTIRYVQSELDEQDREEFFRLKKMQSKTGSG